ncbi:molybdopterin biosynthesis protein CNX1 [Canna indica]|uniref:Molybdopterin biosynthesis protein CNX1 n=1 Tax=Canna indica TaxID=4628 RepID=A0AAQ3KFH8_9LILI|nr:molybdopterin biosynthesis protein CNX1 [Canna indica]
MPADGKGVWWNMLIEVVAALLTAEGRGQWFLDAVELAIANPELNRVHARIVHPIRPDTYRLEYHCAIVRWELDDGSGSRGFIADSTGKQMSSRLLSMKSANALLEFPATGKIFGAVTSIQAILISDISSSLTSKTTDRTASLSVQHERATKFTGS